MIKFQDLFAKGGLSLDRLRNFASIAEAGGLSLAAEGDPARMSLFSKQVKELESFFGVALTRRQGRTMKLTEAGMRLAQLAQAHLGGLADFQQTCRNVPKTISLGASNSVLEWLVLPRIGKWCGLMGKTVFELYSGRTKELVRRLAEMNVDLGLVREDAVVPPLKYKRVVVMTYSLFLPKRLAAGVREGELRTVLPEVPLATSVGGQFRERLETAATKGHWTLRIELACTSFTQAARAVETGAFGAVLPSMAAAELKSGEVVMFDLPFLRSYARSICVAWNPRLAEVRPAVGQAVSALRQALAGDGLEG